MSKEPDCRNPGMRAATSSPLWIACFLYVMGTPLVATFAAMLPTRADAQTCAAEYVVTPGGTPGSTPVISSFTFTPYDNSIFIHYLTDIPTETKILYGTSYAYTDTYYESTLRKDHGAMLVGLAARTTYYFRVLANGSTVENCATTTAGTFSLSVATPGYPGSVTTYRDEAGWANITVADSGFDGAAVELVAGLTSPPGGVDQFLWFNSSGKTWSGYFWPLGTRTLNLSPSGLPAGNYVVEVIGWPYRGSEEHRAYFNWRIIDATLGTTWRDPYAHTEAEAADSRNGVVVTGDRVAEFGNGDYIGFNRVNFGNQLRANLTASGVRLLRGAVSAMVNISVPTGSSGQQVEVRLDQTWGPLVGTITTKATTFGEGFESYYLTFPDWSSQPMGIRNIYLVGKGTKPIGSIDSLRFFEDRPPISAYQRIEAESAQWCDNVSTNRDAVNWKGPGFVCRFGAIDFGSDAPMRVTLGVAVPPAASADTIEVRVDTPTGPLLGTVVLSPASSSQVMALGARVMQGVFGIHDVYLVGRSTTLESYSLDYLRFVPVSSILPAIDVLLD